MAATIAALDLTPTLSGIEEAVAWERGFSVPRPVFAKVDVGLLRGGAAPADLPDLCAFIKVSKRLRLAGVYAHMYSYGAPSAGDMIQAQFRTFKMALSDVRSLGVEVPVEMISSSSTVLDFPDMDMSAVDPGRLLYGLTPSDAPRRSIQLKPALAALKTRLVLKKRVENIGSRTAILPFAPKPGMVVGVLPI